MAGRYPPHGGSFLASSTAHRRAPAAVRWRFADAATAARERLSALLWGADPPVEGEGGPGRGPCDSDGADATAGGDGQAAASAVVRDGGVGNWPPPCGGGVGGSSSAPADVFWAARCASLQRWLGIPPPTGAGAFALDGYGVRRGGDDGGSAAMGAPPHPPPLSPSVATAAAAAGGRSAASGWLAVRLARQAVGLCFFFPRLTLAAAAAAWRSLWGGSRANAAAARRAYTAAVAASLAAAPTYAAWYAAAAELDRLEGAHAWQAEEATVAAPPPPAPPPGRLPAKQLAAIRAEVARVVNVDLLRSRLTDLRRLHAARDGVALAFALRPAASARNDGGLCHPALHAQSRVGTVAVVEDYVNVVAYLLDAAAGAVGARLVGGVGGGGFPERAHPMSLVAEGGRGQGGHSLYSEPAPDGEGGVANGAVVNGGEDDDGGGWDGGHAWQPRSPPPHFVGQPHSPVREGLSPRDTLLFFNELRHAHGRTALMLSGGASMGLHHLGVAKALLEANLLPRVLSGASAGAIIASILGAFTDAELTAIFASPTLVNPRRGTPFAFGFFDTATPMTGRLRRFLRTGAIYDVRCLQASLRENLGDTTFAEAYRRTKRILNVTVTPVRSGDPPLLLNYLTAPNVLIWSAASASSALPVVFAPVTLLAKDPSGTIIPYAGASGGGGADGTGVLGGGGEFIDGSIHADVPLARIAELFNVNHFIVSQANPHFTGLRGSPLLRTRLAGVLKAEAQLRYWQASQLGLLPQFLRSLFPVLVQPYQGDVTIMSPVQVTDLARLFQNPTPASVHSAMRAGEALTWPAIHIIRHHCLLERTLERCVEAVARAAALDEPTDAAGAAAGGTAEGGGGDVDGSRQARRRRRRGSGLFGRTPSWLWLDLGGRGGGGDRPPMTADATSDRRNVGGSGGGGGSATGREVRGEEQHISGGGRGGATGGEGGGGAIALDDTDLVEDVEERVLC
ncbi:hypothetical protein MMPV_006561 [Pyropia vietnamensis]